MTVTDVHGRTVVQLTGDAKAAFTRVVWNMPVAPAPGSRPGRDGRGGFGGGPPVPPGDYLVTLEVGGEKTSKVGRVRERIR